MPEMDALTVPPMLPHFPWPVASDTDTVIYAWGHPTGTPKPMDNIFFEHIFMYAAALHEARKMPDLFQLMLMQCVLAVTPDLGFAN